MRLRLAIALGLLLALLGRPARAQEPYEVGSGDIIQLAVVGQADLTGEFAVDREGMLALPLLGKVKASGLTAKALERKLTTLLADGYLKRPQVSVTVKEGRGLRVFVAGEIAKPGPYVLKGDRTLLTLLGDAGELSQNVGHEVIVIRPPEGGGEGVESVVQPPSDPALASLPNAVPGSQLLRVNLTELLSGNPARNLELVPGDTVYFPRAANVYVTGHVTRPGPIRYQPGMTVFQAITLAGGVGPTGSSKAKLVRLVDGKQVKINAKMTDLLQPEDTVVVPERFF